LDLKKMVAKVTAAAESIEALAGSAEAKAAFANLNKTTTDVQGLVAKLDTQVEPVRAELVRTLHSFHDAAESVRKLLGPQSGLGEEAVRTLQQVTETAESLQQLADFLERNPNALITGKSAPARNRKPARPSMTQPPSHNMQLTPNNRVPRLWNSAKTLSGGR
jgi:paraquat-inducible protein B